MKIGKILVISMLIFSLGALGGCTMWDNMTKGSEAPAAAGAPKGGAVAAPKGPVGRYYEFDDVQVPVGMKLNKEKSILFKVGTFKAGLLVLSDNLESESLINFFVEGMAKDNWVLKSAFKYPSTALFFAKQGKSCIIHIKESAFTTDVEIWVAPGL